MKALYVFVAGEWEITASDGLTRRFGPGDIVRAEDVNSKGHATRLLSDRKGSAVVIQLQQ
jgi:hypothetical protein